MLSLKILALIFTLLVIVKLLFLLFNSEAWIKNTKFLLDKNFLITWIPLTILVGYFVFKNIAIYKIAAVILFTAMLMTITFFSVPEIMLDLRKRVKKIGVKKFWFTILIWGIFAIVVLIDL